MEQLGINFGFLIVQIVNFLIMFVILRKWAFIPIMNMLEKRRQTVAKGLEDARIAQEARENAEKEAEKIMNEARTKAAAEAREVVQRAEEQAKEIVKAAEAKASKAREEALAQVEQDRVRVLSDVRGQVAALSVAAAQKLIGEALDTKRQRSLIDEFFSGVKAGKVTVLEGEAPKGDKAVVTSALPLTKEEEETVKKDILKKLGGKGDVTFRVDPKILGGLVVRVGDKVLDGSVAGQLGALRESLR